MVRNRMIIDATGTAYTSSITERIKEVGEINAMATKSI